MRLSILLILFTTEGIPSLISAVSNPSDKLLFTWLNVVVYCSIRCSRLFIEVSDLLNVRNKESRVCILRRSDSLLTVCGFFFFSCPKLLYENRMGGKNIISSDSFIILRIRIFFKQ